MKKKKKTEELELTIKIEMDGCLTPAVYKNMYRKAYTTIYKEHG